MIFFYEKMAILFGIWIVGGGVTVAGSLTILRKAVEKSSLVESKDPLGRRTNGKAIFQTTICFNDLKCGIPFTPAMNPHSFGQFGTRGLRSMNGGQGLFQPPYQNNAVFVLPILVSWSSINFGIASKLEWRGGGLLISCMNFVG